MAKQLLFNEGVGGGLDNGTVLWENPNPTANFGAQAVSLSDNVNNYDFIGVTYKNSTTNDAQQEVIYRTSEMAQWTSAAGGMFGMISARERVSATSSYYVNRRVTYEQSGDAINFSVSDSSGTTRNNTCIPLQIVGY